jgi:perosamine synthetase
MIPVANPRIGSEEKEFVLSALEAGELSGNFGGFIPRFESEFAQFCSVDFAVAVNNGTAALHLAIAALGIGPGDEVLVQTFTNMATAFAVSYVGAVPVPIDIDSKTWNINPALIKERITSKTKAIIVVHIFGHPVDMDPVLDIAREHGLFVIEDCAEAHGAKYKGRIVGGLGDVGCFSFYANKIITTGEGGMVTTNNSKLAATLRSLKSLGYGTGKTKFNHDLIGFNYRMPNVIAAIGCAQMKLISENIEKKRWIAAEYSVRLRRYADLQLPIEEGYANAVYWMYHINLRGRLAGRRDAFMAQLKACGVETRESFWPLNMQKVYLDQGIVNQNDCPIANNAGLNGLYLPSGPVITLDEIEVVTSAIKKAVLDAH